jgi:uncharacterized membrane protein
MELTSLIDKVLPAPGSALDRVSQGLQAALAPVLTAPRVRPLVRLLHGNELLGHPAHPVVIALPVGAWTLTGWHDLRGAVTGDPDHDSAADTALRFGVLGAVAAAATGLVQYLDTRDAARRETAVHAALNSVALGIYVTSWAMRSGGRRSLGRRLAAGGLGIVSISGWLGGDIAFRHGVGVRPQALRDPGRPVMETSAAPLETAAARHS